MLHIRLIVRYWRWFLALTVLIAAVCGGAYLLANALVGDQGESNPPLEWKLDPAHLGDLSHEDNESFVRLCGVNPRQRVIVTIEGSDEALNMTCRGITEMFSND